MPALRILTVFIRKKQNRNLWGSQLTFAEMARHMTSQGAEIFSLERQPAIARFVPVSYTTFETTRKGRFTLPKLVLDTFHVARQSKCDVIYVPTDYWSESLIPALISSLLLRKPLFLGILDPLYRNEDEQSYRVLLESKIRSKHSPARTILLHSIRRLVTRIAKCCLVSTRLMKRYAIERLHARRAVAIGRGVDELWFIRSQIEKSFDAVFLGRFDKLKGVDILLHGWKEVLKEMPTAKLLIIGSGETTEKTEAVRSLSIELRIDNNVTFAGYVSDPIVRRNMIQSASIFVFPSLKEGFGRAVTEAMASGLPCVLSGIPEIKDLYSERALFTRPADSEDLARKIVELLRNRALQFEFSERGRSFASTFKWSDVARKTIDAMSE